MDGKGLTINKKELALTIITIIYFLGLFRIYVIPTTIFKILSIGICTIFCVIYLKKSSLKKMKSIIFLTFIIFVSTCYNNNYNTGLSNGILYLLQFLSLFIYTSAISNKYGVDKCIDSFYYASVVLMVIMDISVLLGMDLDPTHYQNLVTYLLGNKFMVSYLHMQSFGLYALKSYRKNSKCSKVKTLIFCIAGIFICNIVDCSTGIVGNFVIFLMLILPLGNKVKKIMSKPSFIITVFIIMNLLLLSGQILLQNELVKYVIEKILNESLTLTGRIKIYDIVWDIIIKKPILGYGYNSDIITVILGYGNAQNGILQFLLDCGFIGTFAFFLVLYNYIKGVKNVSKNWPVFCLLYSFLTCSLVEVCLKFNFFIIIALLMVIGSSERDKDERNF